MFITFNVDGTVTFRGGYEYYEAPSWTYDGDFLSLHLPSAPLYDLTTMMDHYRRGFGGHVDIEAKIVWWRLNACSDHFKFQLFRFDRVEPG